MSMITKRNAGIIQSSDPLIALTQAEASLVATCLRLALRTDGLSCRSKENVRRIISKLEDSDDIE